MTDAEIIKALECCSDINDKCHYCPLKDKSRGSCVGILMSNVTDLINRQKAEIEKLKENNDAYGKTVPFLLREERAEAAKEFANELIDKIKNTPTKFESTYYMYRDGMAFRQNEIISIIKEMVVRGDGYCNQTV